MIEIRYIYDWEGKPVNEYTIKNGKYQFSAINIGAAITKIIVPNYHDNLENILLRYYDYKNYRNNAFLLGTLIDYQKFCRKVECQLNVYFKCIFEKNTLIFRYSKDSQFIEVKYSLLDHHLLIEYNTNTDIRLANCLFFNLSGNLKSDIKNHQLKIGNRDINLTQEMEFSHFDGAEEAELVVVKLNENGIKVVIDSAERCVSISNGKQFNQLFQANKDQLASLYSGLGVVLGGVKFNQYVDYQFN